MGSVDSILKRVRRRMVFAQAIRFAGTGLLGGAIAAIGVLLIDRIGGVTLPWMVYPAISTAGMIAGFGLAIVRRPSLEQVAIRTDRAFGLKDRLGTAASIDRLSAKSPFAAFVRNDAERVARGLDVRCASPLRVTGAWGFASVALVVLAAAVLYLPSVVWAKAEAPLTAEERALLDAEREQAAAEVESLLEGTKERELPGASDRDYETLGELARQMRREDLPPEEFAKSRDAAAERIDDLARRVAQKSEEDERILDALDERFRGLESPAAPGEATPPDSELAERLREALTSADYDEAARALDDLEKRRSEMSEKERRQLSESLRSLAEQIESSKANTSRDREAREQALRDALREQGVHEETIDRLMPDQPQEAQPEQDEAAQPQPSTPEVIEESLRESGVDEQVARDLAEEIERRQRERQAQDEADRTADELSNALEETADEVERNEPRQPRDPQQGPQREGQRAGEQDERQESSQQQSGQQDRESEQRQGADETQQQQKQDGSRHREEAGQEERSQEGDRREQRGRPEQGEQQESETEQQEQAGRDQKQSDQQKSDQQKSEQQQQNGQQRDQSQPGQRQQQGERAQEQGEGAEQQQKEGAQQREGARQQEGGQEQPGSREQQQGGDQEQRDARWQGEGEGQEQQNASGAERAKRMLEELEKRRSGTQQSQQESERLRDAARRMAERMTPEERRQFGEWAKQYRREQDAPPQPGGGEDAGRGAGSLADAPPEGSGVINGRDDVDLRDEAPERIVADWLSDEVREGDSGRTSETGGGQLVRRAQRAAERAVSDSTVPRRYHDLIKRYFGRFDKTVEKARDSKGQSASPPQNDAAND